MFTRRIYCDISTRGIASSYDNVYQRSGGPCQHAEMASFTTIEMFNLNCQMKEHLLLINSSDCNSMLLIHIHTLVYHSNIHQYVFIFRFPCATEIYFVMLLDLCFKLTNVCKLISYDNSPLHKYLKSNHGHVLVINYLFIATNLPFVFLEINEPVITRKQALLSREQTN